MKMKLRYAALALSAVASLAAGQTMQRVSVPVAAPVKAAAAASLDYPSLYQREVEKNRELKAQVATLSQRIQEMTHPGGSLVRAYCETPTLSRNTAGASNDCAKNGFGCEPVSGLCRTSVRSSDECAPGYIYCATNGACVRDANGCPSG